MMKNLLWCDLKTFKEKADFIQLGRAVETGIIAPAMQATLAHDYNALVIAVKENEELTQWITAISNGHQQVPDWIKQSAKSLLVNQAAKGGEE